MKILVTGCTGLLGSNICYLLKERHEIFAISRGMFKMPGVQHKCISFLDYESVEALLRAYDIDVVIHCAAITNVDECETDFSLAKEVNSTAAIKLCATAAKCHSKFVFISSDAVFGDFGNLPYKETDSVNPLNNYGRTKVLAEKGILEIKEALVIRTNMYGFNWLQNKTSLSEWVIESLNRSKPITMFNNVAFSPLLVNTLVEAIEQAMLKNLSGILHLGTLDAITKYEFGIAIERLMGLSGLIKESSVDDFGFTAKRSHNMVLDSRLAISYGITLPQIDNDLKRMIGLENSGYRKLLQRSK